LARTLAALAINLQANSAQLVQELKKANDNMQSFGRSVSSVGKKAVALYAVVQAAQVVKDASAGIVTTAATFETLNSSLETVFGSAEVAARKFEELRGFAAETPFTINQVTEAAIKMRALGLDPSIASIRSMGNTASAMGKPLMQFVEAVADAATGEMERLKEFGIKASKEGDKFKFTFQGVETVVANSANNIQKYLMDVGNVQFAGAIDKQAETLYGVFAQAQGAVENFAAAFSEKSGLSASIKSATKRFTEFMNTLTGKVEEIGQVETVEELEAKLKKLNDGIKVINQTYAFSEQQKERIITKKREEIAAIEDTIKALQKEADVKQKIIDDQNAKEENSRQEALKKTNLDNIAKQAEQREKELSKIFGGDPTERLRSMEEQLMTEDELIFNNAKQRLEMLNKFAAEEIGTEQRLANIKQRVIDKYLSDKANLEETRRKQEKARQQAYNAETISAFTGFLSVMGQRNKGFAIAEALVNTYLGVSKTLATYPYPFNLAPAGLHLAAGLAQVSNIRSGSSGGSIGGGSAPTVPTTPIPSVQGVEDLAANDEPQTKVITVAVEGDGELLPRSVLRELADELNSLDEANVRITV